MSALVETIKDRCQRCYTCVRNCPAKAIKVEDAQAKVIVERCIGCGSCVKVCTQSAKEVESGMEPLQAMIEGGEHLIAAIAPSFPVAFDSIRPSQVVTALERVGFAEVVEVAFGAELVARECARLVSSTDSLLISSSCPAVVVYIEKYLPALVPHLAPVVSPMIATGRYLKAAMPGAKVVFIGPCIAKKGEIKDPNVAGAVDVVLTFREAELLLARAGIDPATLPDGVFGGPRPALARLFPTAGGLLAAAGIQSDLLKNDVIATHGRQDTLALLHELEKGSVTARFADVLFCDGCIDGPRIQNKLGHFARRQILADYARSAMSQEAPRQPVATDERVDLSREYRPQPVVLPIPTDEEIREALRRVNKVRPEDELNCGACGYESCREKAIAVCQGLAESEMCLPYLIDKLQENYARLERLHSELKETQTQLVHSERLASMGQLAAGIAHEINNPLGTILLYAHLLLDETGDGDGRARKLQLVAEEADRCRHIVSGLLRFARQNRLATEPVDINQLLRETLSLLAGQPKLERVEITTEMAPDLPILEADPEQLKQVFLNILTNGAEAMPDGGRLSVTTQFMQEWGSVRIAIADTGCGIPEENITRVFNPFFTTKEIGEGTGLGLAIAYGIVKMHRGQIAVQSEVGKGTTFTVDLRVTGPGPDAKRAQATIQPDAESPIGADE